MDNNCETRRISHNIFFYGEFTVAVAPKQVRDYFADEVFNNIEIVLFLNVLEIHFSRRVLILRCHEFRLTLNIDSK